MLEGKTNLKGALHINANIAPGPGLLWKLKNAIRPGFIRGWVAAKIIAPAARLFGVMTGTAELSLVLFRANGERVNFGVVGFRVVTTAFVNFLVDNLQTDTTAIGDFKYHDSGVGTTAENASNTDIETTDGESRVSGTQTEGTNPYDYRSVGTISYTSTKAITEHGLFNASTAGTLLDRTVFSAVNVGSGDSIQFTYTVTFAAGS